MAVLAVLHSPTEARSYDQETPIVRICFVSDVILVFAIQTVVNVYSWDSTKLRCVHGRWVLDMKCLKSRHQYVIQWCSNVC